MVAVGSGRLALEAAVVHQLALEAAVVHQLAFEAAVETDFVIRYPASFGLAYHTNHSLQ